ncbi:hypothetical protein HOLleu_00306 [Holothuria leucospilota]|uniref:Cysteine dioxygenase n=1 Tax=Holothuria leucospilota TaxID=206669 RepID=A0A9Q1CNT1_HOLLE|nr:hypothetical protein HOLleu_00306 [Holothuria leucospilota]
MSQLTTNRKADNSLRILEKNPQPVWTKAFPVLGKGTLLLSIQRKSPFYINITDKKDDDSDDYTSIILWVGRGAAAFSIKNGCLIKTIEHVSTSKEGDVGYDPKQKVTYWFSYDSDNMTIKYGKGYCMEGTTLMKHTFEGSEDPESLKRFYFDPATKKNVEFYDTDPWSGRVSLAEFFGVSTESPDVLIDVEKEICFSPYPFKYDRPPIVRDSSLTNMFDIDLGKYTYSASLPEASKVLYENVTGVNMSLDYGEQKYKLEDAIRHSMEHPTCALGKCLKDKKGEFGPDNEMYIRVTLGKNYGNSPGTPYVLELWPKDCGSPVHNHGNAFAAIRVLHGGLTIEYYNKHKTDGPIGQFDVKKDDVTWIAPNWYQTHKLWNYTNDFCATIQCYQYGERDDIHWPYFDYVNTGTSITDIFVPDSDFTFTEMYNIVMKEYADYMESQGK